ESIAERVDGRGARLRRAGRRWIPLHAAISGDLEVVREGGVEEQGIAGQADPPPIGAERWTVTIPRFEDVEVEADRHQGVRRQLDEREGDRFVDPNEMVAIVRRRFQDDWSAKLAKKPFGPVRAVDIRDGLRRGAPGNRAGL